MPHEASRVSSRIAKTALGSENMVPWYVTQDLAGDLLDYSSAGYTIAALEQTKSAIQLPDYAPPHKIVLLLGNELMGVDPSLLEEYKTHLVIPMYGQKESFNVVQAAAMTLFWLRFAYNR